MGAWDELDTLVTAVNDTSALDDLINVCEDSDFADIFQPAIDTAEALKDAIEEGTEQGLLITANKMVSMEQTEILDTGKHPYSQGVLGTSIEAEEQGDGYLIGTTINHIYPMSIEYGADIYPVTASVLRVHESQVIDWDGEPDEEGYYYFKEAHIEAKPFVEPAFERLVDLIEGQGFGVFRSVCNKMDNVMKG